MALSNWKTPSQNNTALGGINVEVLTRTQPRHGLVSASTTPTSNATWRPMLKSIRGTYSLRTWQPPSHHPTSWQAEPHTYLHLSDACFFAVLHSTVLLLTSFGLHQRQLIRGLFTTVSSEICDAVEDLIYGALTGVIEGAGGAIRS